MFPLLFILVSLFSPTLVAQNKQFTQRGNCDIPSPILSSLSKTGLNDCETACGRNKDCESFVHISGWNRCNLIGKGGKNFTITFISADKNVNGSLNAAQKNKDHSGKDLRKVDSKDWAHCEKSCNDDAKCQAVTYIEGYKACWLKDVGGKFRDKVFTCGQLNSEAK